MSQRPPIAVPAANPALYAAALEGGYKPNAYLTDYHDPYGGIEGGTFKGSGGGKGHHIHLGSSNILDREAKHPMHPHLDLVQAMSRGSQAFTQCGVPLGHADAGRG